jgi:hypothetical protein
MVNIVYYLVILDFRNSIAFGRFPEFHCLFFW